MSLSTLRDFLDENNVQYMIIPHPQGIAATTHITGRELAKTVMVLVDGHLDMAVVPISTHVDLLNLKKHLGAGVAELAPETVFRDHFPECETAAVPPFGNLYGMNVFADHALALEREISFNAGSIANCYR